MGLKSSAGDKHPPYEICWINQIMRIKLLALFVLLAFCVCLPLRAEEDAAKTQTPIRVLYSKNVPAVVRGRVPRGGSSKFFGVCKLKTSGPEVLFHLYSTATINKAKDENASDTRLYVVDVFERRSQKSKARLINSIQFDSSVKNSKRVSADVLWVDPKKKTIPILKLGLLSEGFYGGPYGSEFLVNFAKGLKGKATVQEFESSSDGYGSSDFYSCEEINESGLMVVVERYTTQEVDEKSGESLSERHKDTCEWSGDRFCAPDATTIERK